MVKNLFPHASRVALLAIAMIMTPGTLFSAGALMDSSIVWYVDDRRPIAVPEERDPTLGKDFYEATVSRPVARHIDPQPLSRRIGSIFGSEVPYQAQNVNALDEVPNSTWFTNRIGLFAVSVEQAALGPGKAGPDRSGMWEVVGGKSKGVTPGFQIKDALGQRFLLKFDPAGFPSLTISPGAISAAILHTIGYNVPEDVVVEFTRQDLTVGKGVELELTGEKTVLLTEAVLDSLLEPIARTERGTMRGLASKFLPGKPVGPFDYRGSRKDDPNDTVHHQDRRELRGLKVFAAWLKHFDTKQDNTLDIYVGEPGEGHLVHYLIDFASTLGGAGRGPTRMWGREYAIDFTAITGRTLALGLHEDGWRRLERPSGLEEIGYYESEDFDYTNYKPQQPNSAFANLTWRDGYWAAKIISAFSDEHLKAIVERGQYQDPRSARYMREALAHRRDEIVRFWFDRMPPLDFFAWDGDRISFADLGIERGYYPTLESATRYRVRCANTTSHRQTQQWSDWLGLESTVLDLTTGSVAAILEESSQNTHPFLVLECQLDRGEGWSRSVKVFFSRAREDIVAVER